MPGDVIQEARCRVGPSENEDYLSYRTLSEITPLAVGLAPGAAGPCCGYRVSTPAQPTWTCLLNAVWKLSCRKRPSLWEGYGRRLGTGNTQAHFPILPLLSWLLAAHCFHGASVRCGCWHLPLAPGTRRVNVPQTARCPGNILTG